MRELKALEPGDPLTHTLGWPEFALSGAVVTSTKTGNLVNLFEVFQNGTCMIKGKLATVDEKWKSKGQSNQPKKYSTRRRNLLFLPLPYIL